MEGRGVEERHRYWSRDKGREERKLREDIRERMDRGKKGWEKWRSERIGNQESRNRREKGEVK